MEDFRRNRDSYFMDNALLIEFIKVKGLEEEFDDFLLSVSVECEIRVVKNDIYPDCVKEGVFTDGFIIKKNR